MGDYRTEDLAYQLIDGVVDVRPLRVLAQRSFQWRANRVTVSILGASHAVEVAGPDGVLTELLACGVVEHPRRAVSSAANVDRDLEVTVGGTSCATSIRRASLDDPQLPESDAETALVHRFRSWSAGPDAVTRVEWKTSPERLEVVTLHTYPEERAEIRTRSLFTPASEVCP